MRERARAAAAALRAELAGKTIAIASHAVVNQALLAEALGLKDADALRLDQAYCAANVIDFAGEAPLVRLVNAVP